jgi:hypothetical protein
VIAFFASAAHSSPGSRREGRCAASAPETKRNSDNRSKHYRGISRPTSRKTTAGARINCQLLLKLTGLLGGVAAAATAVEDYAD